MIVAKNLRVDVLGEPLFEKVNLVIRPKERIAMLGANMNDVVTFMQALAGDVELDEGSVSIEGEQVTCVLPAAVQSDVDPFVEILASRATFVLLAIAGIADDLRSMDRTRDFIRRFQGGLLIASEDADLMRMAKISRVLELHPSTKSITSFTGTYDAYLVEREKNEARLNEAYKKQQKEKRRLEEWLEQKRKEAAIDRRSPEKGKTIRAKAKYLQREILDKEIPKPSGAE